MSIWLTYSFRLVLKNAWQKQQAREQIPDPAQHIASDAIPRHINYKLFRSNQNFINYSFLVGFIIHKIH